MLRSLTCTIILEKVPVAKQMERKFTTPKFVYLWFNSPTYFDFFFCFIHVAFINYWWPLWYWTSWRKKWKFFSFNLFSDGDSSLQIVDKYCRNIGHIQENLTCNPRPEDILNCFMKACLFPCKGSARRPRHIVLKGELLEQ